MKGKNNYISLQVGECMQCRYVESMVLDPLNTQSRHKDPKILADIFQSFDDGQNKILFRALIRKNKRPVGWHKMPWTGEAGGRCPLPWNTGSLWFLRISVPPRRIAAKPDSGARKVLLAEKLWWETAPSLVNCNANLWLVTSRVAAIFGSWGQESGLRGGGRAPWVVLGRLSRCKTLLTICTCTAWSVRTAAVRYKLSNRNSFRFSLDHFFVRDWLTVKLNYLACGVKYV